MIDTILLLSFSLDLYVCLLYAGFLSTCNFRRLASKSPVFL